MNKKLQKSESIEVAIFLALSGGLMDAYSYLLRGEVFANAQTGNILLFGVYASKGNLEMSIHYAFPIFSFIFGIIISQFIRIRNIKRIHWRQISLFFEIILLIIVSFLPKDLNYLANALTSLACGVQVQTFRKLYGKNFSTTMCIGNLRSGTYDFLEYFSTKDKKYLVEGSRYFLIIICFVFGAIIGSNFGNVLGFKTILISPTLLFIAFLIMFIDKEKGDDIFV